LGRGERFQEILGNIFSVGVEGRAERLILPDSRLYGGRAGFTVKDSIF
jgi:hypothetical protein